MRNTDEGIREWAHSVSGCTAGAADRGVSAAPETTKGRCKQCLQVDSRKADKASPVRSLQVCKQFKNVLCLEVIIIQPLTLYALLNLHSTSHVLTCVVPYPRHSRFSHSLWTALSLQNFLLPVPWRCHSTSISREAQAWNESQLQQWAKVAAEREADNLALLQYQRQDEALIKQLNSRLEK